MTAGEVADMLSVPLRFVREHTRSGAIPCVRLGRRYVRYDRGDVLAWVADCKRPGRPVATRKHVPKGAS
jgi:excisionase family DNA binding protein